MTHSSWTKSSAFVTGCFGTPIVFLGLGFDLGYLSLLHPLLHLGLGRIRFGRWRDLSTLDIGVVVLAPLPHESVDGFVVPGCLGVALDDWQEDP